jgi:cell division protein FtsL
MSRKQAVKNQQRKSLLQQSPLLAVLRWSGLVNRSSLLLFVCMAVVLASGLMVVRTTHQNRVAFNELQQLKDEAVQLDVSWGQLLIEQSTFGVEGRIEQKAVEQLDMRVPEVADIVMVGNHE